MRALNYLKKHESGHKQVEEVAINSQSLPPMSNSISTPDPPPKPGQGVNNVNIVNSVNVGLNFLPISPLMLTLTLRAIPRTPKPAPKSKDDLFWEIYDGQEKDGKVSDADLRDGLKTGFDELGGLFQNKGDGKYRSYSMGARELCDGVDMK